MKIATIIADVEYIQPAGTIEKYKYGKVILRESDKSETVIHENPSIAEMNVADLRREMNKTPSSNMKPIEATIVGKE